jgi:hypothetical protein
MEEPHERDLDTTATKPAIVFSGVLEILADEPEAHIAAEAAVGPGEPIEAEDQEPTVEQLCDSIDAQRIAHAERVRAELLDANREIERDRELDLLRLEQPELAERLDEAREGADDDGDGE